MKLILSALVLSCVSVVSHAADSPCFSGKYKINLNLRGHDKPFFCVFTQEKQAIGGYCITEAGSANVTGKFDGHNVSWSYTVNVSGQSITSNYKGTVDGAGKASGAIAIPGMPTGMPGMPAGIPLTAVPSQ